MERLNEVIDKIRKYGLVKNIENPKLVITTKPELNGNMLSYKEIKVDHEDKKVILDCLKELHKDFGEDIEFLSKIDLVHKTEYSGYFGEFTCKAFF